jgi:outer membrane protein W
MKTIKICGLVIAAFAIAISAKAQQDKVQIGIRHSVGIPVGSFNNEVSNTSARGGDLSILYGINDNISIGGSIGFQDFYQKYPRQIYKTTDGEDLSAVLTNSIQVTPLFLTGKYNFLPHKTIQPYASLGVGANLITYNQLLGEYTNVSQNRINFALRPELGVSIPVIKNKLMINAGAAYNYMPLHYNGVDNLDNIAIQGGIILSLRK